MDFISNFTLIFDKNYIKEINSIFGKPYDVVEVTPNEVRITLDWQSEYLIEKNKIKFRRVYDFYYVERGSRIKYASFKTVKELKEGVLIRCKTYH